MMRLTCAIISATLLLIITSGTMYAISQIYIKSEYFICLSWLLFSMLSARFGISVYKKSIRAGYSVKDTVLFISYIFGLFVATIGSIFIFFIFKDRHGSFYEILHFIFICILGYFSWKFARKWFFNKFPIRDNFLFKNPEDAIIFAFKHLPENYKFQKNQFYPCILTDITKTQNGTQFGIVKLPGGKLHLADIPLTAVNIEKGFFEVVCISENYGKLENDPYFVITAQLSPEFSASYGWKVVKKF